MSEIQQKDLVLSINEYAYVIDRTKGNVCCWVGPVKTSLSTSDALVNFNESTKRFEECSYGNAINLFTTAPEGWYCILKNPAAEDKHPNPGMANTLPDKINIGRKVNIKGPVTFALYPGQMAKVVRGHALRSNQYLLARVYEAESANTSIGEILDTNGNKIEGVENKNYVNGQILVIKGTEVSFYIPPTGIEVIAIQNNSNLGYVREAVTLERLEYCILKDENGNKRYVHGPAVVFPNPTESFVENSNGKYVFRAIELSKISGIYVKVIAEYTDVVKSDDGENEIQIIHPVGEELFITGDDQMIYYPRPEHAIINYDGKTIHHAIAIPEGEGRYVMNRLDGNIKTVHGPCMYLPDPRTEVVVKRKLTQKQCELWFPGNNEVANYNMALSEKSVEKNQTKSAIAALNSLTTSFVDIEANASISRGTSYTKPRTVMLDTKYDGVVSVDVWTGYAVDVISKNGTRKVVCGPQTILLDYDQTFEVLSMSTGRPKTTDNLIHTVFLRHENNKISDLINVETKDFVKATIKVSYCVSFDPACKERWFNIENYVKYLTDHERSLIKRMAKQYTIEEFYQNYADLVRAIAIDKENKGDGHKGRFFEENGMYVHDCEVLSISVEDDIQEMLQEHQYAMVKDSLQLSSAEKRIQVLDKLAEAHKHERELRNQEVLDKLALERKEAISRLEIEQEIQQQRQAKEKAGYEAQQDMSALLDAIALAKIEREKLSNSATLEYQKSCNNIEKEKQEAYAATVAQIMNSISPDLIAALTSNANATMLEAITKNMSPYAIANGMPVAETVNLLMRGTPLENSLTEITSAMRSDK